jgi:hypothetical protein
VFAQLTPTDLNASHAQPQELGTSVQINVFAQLQKQFGTETHVSAQSTPSDKTASAAHLKNIGMKRPKPVFAQPVKSGTDNTAFAHHQQLSGTVPNAFAQPTLTDQTAFNAQPQDSGTVTTVSVLKRESGTVKTVSVPQDFSDPTVFNAHLRNIGTKEPKPVFAQPVKSGPDNTALAHHQQLSGTVPNAFAQPTLTDQTAFNAQPQDSGTVTIVSVLKRESGTVKTVSVPQDFSDPTVFNAHLRNIGTKEPKPVFAQPVKSGPDNTALAHHQQLSGTVPNAFAQPTLTDQTAFNAQPQDSGTVTIVSVLKRESGTVKTVSVPQDFSDPTAFNAHLRNIGTKEPKLVFAHLHSSGTVNTVSAQLDIL